MGGRPRGGRGGAGRGGGGWAGGVSSNHVHVACLAPPGPVGRQIEAAELQHRKDLAAGFGEVWLPHALGVKKPSAARELAWQYVFDSFAPLTRPAG